MKKLIVLALLATSLTMTAGCAVTSTEETPVSSDTRRLQIPVGDDYLFEFNIPSDWNVSETDNNIYWKFSDSSTIYVTDILDHFTEANDVGLYVSDVSVVKDFDDEERSVCLNTTQTELLSGYMASGEIVDVDTELYKEYKLRNLPTYADKQDEMSLSGNNLYMPDGVVESSMDIYTSELLCDGADWLECWIADGKLDELRNHFVTTCLANSGESRIDNWYESEEILYLKAGGNILAAKRLRYNEWYVYYGSEKYEDYILTGINKVRLDLEDL